MSLDTTCLRDFCGVAGGRGRGETSCEGAFILVHHLIDLRCRALIGTATITSNIDAISGAVAAACPAFASSSPPAEEFISRKVRAEVTCMRFMKTALNNVVLLVGTPRVLPLIVDRA